MTSLSLQRKSRVPLWFRPLINSRNFALLPFAISLPFFQYPKILEGDTQPWALMAGVLSALMFKRIWLSHREIFLIFLSVLVVFPFIFLLTSTIELIRVIYLQSAFVIFLIVVRREKGDVFPIAIRFTIVLWLIAALYQFAAVRFGMPIEISGRFNEARGGVPSLTAEPSVFGVMSVLQIMYLLNESSGRYRAWFISMGYLAVILSGSLLAMIMSIFTLVKLPRCWVFPLIGAAIVLITADANYKILGFSNRIELFIQNFNQSKFGLLDSSFNLRFGHIHFTLFDQFLPSLIFLHPGGFMEQYNQFANDQGQYIETESNFILTTMGEFVFNGGIFGLAFVIGVLVAAVKVSPSRKFEKVFFLILCLLNPISLSNPFLLIYLLQRDGMEYSR